MELEPQFQPVMECINLDLESDLEKILQFLGCEEPHQILSALVQLHDPPDLNTPNLTFESLRLSFNNEDMPSCFVPHNYSVDSEMPMSSLALHREPSGPLTSELARSSITEDLAGQEAPFHAEAAATYNILSDASNFQEQLLQPSDDDKRNLYDESSELDCTDLSCLVSQAVMPVFSGPIYSSTSSSNLEANSKILHSLSDQYLLFGEEEGSAAVTSPKSSLSSFREEGVEENISLRPLPNSYADRVLSRSKRKDVKLSSDDSPQLKPESMKHCRIKGKKRLREPRLSYVFNKDVVEDGYKWRKYGQKALKNNPFPRSYYRCTYNECLVKKTVERSSEDSGLVITTYEGLHVHPSPFAIRSGSAAVVSLFTNTTQFSRPLFYPHFCTNYNTPASLSNPRISAFDIGRIRGASHLPQLDNMV